MSSVETAAFAVELFRGADIAPRQRALRQFAAGLESVGRCYDPAWLLAVCDGLGHVPYVLEATRGGRIVGLLPLALVRSLLFGRFLVSLPYVNSAGVIGNDREAASAMIEHACRLADELNVRHLELRHEVEQPHAKLTHRLTSKVHMRLALPDTAEELWKRFNPKVRNQIRKAEKQPWTIHWGRVELLNEFYAVFSQNMRDLGTPVFTRRLFQSILGQFPEDAELCVLRLDRRPVAAALLVHHRGITEVPSASSLRAYNTLNANMLMYWHLLQRAIERGQARFDFGRSSVDSNTFRFKQQWGAQPESAVWQYYVRKGTVDDVRRESGKYDRAVDIWRRLPLCLTRLLGPWIVRGIP